jgi:hypothetical protein
METLKNSVRGIFQLASSRYTPATGSVNQALRAWFTPGHPAPGQEALNKSALPYRPVRAILPVRAPGDRRSGRYQAAAIPGDKRRQTRRKQTLENSVGGLFRFAA